MKQGDKFKVFENGIQKYAGIHVYDEMPQGWQEIKGAMTAPEGYVWIHNGKSLFGGEYRHGFIRRERME